MNNSGSLPSPDVAYSAPMRGRLAVQGLQGASVANAVFGGLPSSPGLSEPSGDLGEGLDLPVTLANTQRGRDEKSGGYALRPGLPSTGTLDYLHKFSSTTLITLALVLLIVYGVLRPRRAIRLLEGRAGGGGL